MSSFEYTFRCPDCLREKRTYSIGALRHDGCLQKKNKEAAYWVLVEIDGHDVSRPEDPQPATSKK